MKRKLVEIIYRSLEELNLQLDQPIEITETTTIFGEDGVLDSLDFVNLLVIVEDNLFQEFDQGVTILSERAFAKKYNPFANVESLTTFIEELLGSEE